MSTDTNTTTEENNEHVARSYAYIAQTDSGRSLTGTIDALGPEDAKMQLSSIGVSATEITLAEDQRKRKAFGREDFLAFNEQLAYMTEAGLPIERGLRLIAQDMQSGGLAGTVNDLADELENGVPFAEAFEKYRTRFPAQYGRMIEAGIKANRLPAMLFNIGRHMSLVGQLRSTLWSVLSYPTTILACLMIVFYFISVVIVPNFREMYEEFDMELSVITQMVFTLSEAMPWLSGLVIVCFIAWLITWAFMRSQGILQGFIEAVFMPLPLIGPVIRYGLISSWCNAFRLAIEAGLDLPQALQLAADASHSPSLAKDSEALSKVAAEGRSLCTVGKMKVLPLTIPTAVDLASSDLDLPTILDRFTEMYYNQAQMKISILRVFLVPFLLFVLAMGIGFVVMGVFMPLIQIIRAVS